jgi:hypothetical protein
MNTVNFDAMGKEELRKACKAAGISYGKLNNDGMRNALKQAAADAQVAADQDKLPFAPAQNQTKSEPAQAPQEDSTNAALEDAVQGAEEAPKGPAPGTIVEATVQRVEALQIEKNRAERNGVQRQSKGSIGDQLWAIYDALQAALKGDEKVAHKDAKAAAVARGFNPNSASIAFFRWVKFNEPTPEELDEDSGEE